MPRVTTGTATPSVRTPIAARLAAISSFTFDATPTDPQDGEDVTFTVPGDGEGDAYTVEIIDVNTSTVFTTLSWTGSQYEGTVTFNGTDGDSFTFEAKKTRDSDSATKRSDNQETVQVTSQPFPDYSLNISDTTPSDGDTVILTVPGDGYGDVYTVEVLRSDDSVFATLTWNGNDFTASVTVTSSDDGTILEGLKTRDSDGKTKRSQNTVSISITTEAKTFQRYEIPSQIPANV